MNNEMLLGCHWLSLIATSENTVSSEKHDNYRRAAVVLALLHEHSICAATLPQHWSRDHTWRAGTTQLVSSPILTRRPNGTDLMLDSHILTVTFPVEFFRLNKLLQNHQSVFHNWLKFTNDPFRLFILILPWQIGGHVTSDEGVISVDRTFIKKCG